VVVVVGGGVGAPVDPLGTGVGAVVGGTGVGTGVGDRLNIRQNCIDIVQSREIYFSYVDAVVEVVEVVVGIGVGIGVGNCVTTGAKYPSKKSSGTLIPTVEYAPPLATQNEPSSADTRSSAAIITPLQHYDETTTNKTRTYNILTFWFQPKVFQFAISLLNTQVS
jgi:hypothetical protein